MSKCLRCGAGAEWIQGKVAPEDSALAARLATETQARQQLALDHDHALAQLQEAERLLRTAAPWDKWWKDDVSAFLAGAQGSAKAADSPRPVLLDKSLRERAHELMREACSAWSDVVIPPHGGLSQAKCDYAAAIEARLKAIIDELADGYEE